MLAILPGGRGGRGWGRENKVRGWGIDLRRGEGRGEELRSDVWPTLRQLRNMLPQQTYNLILNY